MAQNSMAEPEFDSNGLCEHAAQQLAFVIRHGVTVVI
jgi:hypothetical protein